MTATLTPPDRRPALATASASGPRGRGPRGGELARQRARRARGRRFVSDLLVWAVWASGAAAAALYLASGGMADWGSLSGVLTGLGIVAGLVGSDFVLVMLVLAARIPLLDAAIGHDRAMGVHRQLGKPALYLILGHFVLLTLGYGLAQGIDPVTETGILWTTPDMIWAYLALGAMVAVVITSLVAVRRKLSYEFWYVVHLLSYVSVLGAIPHQLSASSVLIEGAWQRGYWIALYVVALGSIVIFRFLEPMIQSLRHGMTVERIEWLTNDTAAIHLRGRDLDKLRARGGQFFYWRFWTSRTWWHVHPLSLSAAPTATRARITVRVLGKGTSRITDLLPGTRVSFSGPFGLFTDAARGARRLAVVAAGVGVTPVRAMLEDSRLEPGEATVVVRSSHDDALIHWDELRSLADAQGTALYRITGPRGRTGGWMSQRDRDRGVTLRTVFPQLDDSDLYICGPTAWADSLVAEARAAGVPDRRIHMERFDW
ncbi:MAG: ferric reductase-like transmembrane domain-containing protein [Actinomycetales bacterium]|nr:ferric reductase-like transmembrane domain-containing protein [Actinomycetales bacterium]